VRRAGSARPALRGVRAYRLGEDNLQENCHALLTVRPGRRPRMPRPGDVHPREGLALPALKSASRRDCGVAAVTFQPATSRTARSEHLSGGWTDGGHCRLVTGGDAANAKSESSAAAGWTLCVLWRRAPRDGSPEWRSVLLKEMRAQVARSIGRAQPVEAHLTDDCSARGLSVPQIGRLSPFHLSRLHRCLRSDYPPYGASGATGSGKTT
jgi:hypothetical protein